MCGYKSRESLLMLTVAIQKEFTMPTLPNQKLKVQFLSFLIRNFAIEFTSVSKEKEFNSGFDDWHSDVLLFFLYYLHERSPIGKK